MFFETKVDILHEQETKEKQYIYTANNEKIQPQFGFKDFEASKLSSCFLFLPSRLKANKSCINSKNSTKLD